MLTLSGIDSQYDRSAFGLHMTAYVQIWNGMWALFGVPVIIGGGVGALYRIESHLRIYQWYVLFSLVSSVFWTIFWFFSGQACDAIAAREVQGLGSGFVCGAS